MPTVVSTVTKNKMSRDTRKCIRDFVHHVDALEAEEDPEGNGFNREYRLIHEVQVKNRRENVFQMTAGRADNNLKKNRYKDILPYDEHRVLLSPIENEENSDYINASRLMGVKGTGGYIASQGPLASTVNDYWRMIWEMEVEIIFMACKIVELGKIKCKQYWNDVDTSDTFGDITVFTEAEEEISSDFIRRKFRVTRGTEVRHMIQFHYLGWPDHGIPDNPAHIRDLISIMRQSRQNDEVPLLVHCSAGCGRTGAIVAIDFVWTLLQQGRFDETFSLYDLICNFREQRMSMVQTPDQYALVNKVLKTLCEEWLEKMASHTYVNVELKQATQNEEDNIYENEVIVESSGSPNLSPELVQDRLAGRGADTGPGPEIVELPPPSFQAPKPPTSAPAPRSNYENIAIQGDKTLVTGQSDKAAEDGRLQTQHKTIIHLGKVAGASASKPAAGGSGGQQEVINLVIGGGDKTPKSQVSPATHTGAAPQILPVHSKAAVAAGVPPVVSSSSPHPPRDHDSYKHQAPLSPRSPSHVNTPQHDIYSTVNKGRVSESPRSTVNKGNTVDAIYSTVNKGHMTAKTPSARKAGNIEIIPVAARNLGEKPALKGDVLAEGDYSLAEVPVGGVKGDLRELGIPPSSPGCNVGLYDNVGQQRVNGAVIATESGGIYSRAGVVHTDDNSGGAGVYSLAQIPKGSQDFGERLPRVKGPVPLPAAWTREQ